MSFNIHKHCDDQHTSSDQPLLLQCMAAEEEHRCPFLHHSSEHRFPLHDEHHRSVLMLEATLTGLPWTIHCRRRSLPHAVPGCQTACYKFCNSVYITLFKNVIHTASRNDTLKLLPGSGIGLATNEQVLFVLAICPTGFAIMLSSSQRSVNPKCSMSSKVSNPRLDTFYT